MAVVTLTPLVPGRLDQLALAEVTGDIWAQWVRPTRPYQAPDFTVASLPSPPG